ncbi:MAG: NfeD family protein [Dehalococcoidales bacterium]|nr:NfeD family protein [Dehalococcoidales bacterium]
MNKSRLIFAIFSNIVWETLIASAAIWGLPRLGVNIPPWGIAIIMIAFAVYAFFVFRTGSRILRKTALPGYTDMIGVTGIVTRHLNPGGFVNIKGELWEAEAENGDIETGTEVTVVGQKGLKLLVKARLS